MRSLEELKDVHYPYFPNYLNEYVILGVFLCLICVAVVFYFYTKKTIKKYTLKELESVLKFDEDNFDKMKKILYVFKKYLSVVYPETKGYSEEKLFLFLKGRYPKTISDNLSVVLQRGKFCSPCAIDSIMLKNTYNFVLDWIEFQK